MDNNRRMVKLGIPIVNIEAKKSNPESRMLNPDAFCCLNNSLFLEKGEKVVLEIIICTKQDYYSGSIEVVKNIVYKEVSLPPPKLPIVFWVEIDDYNNP